MECDTELLPDQMGDPGSGPELGGEAELAREMFQPGEHLPLLVAVELGRGTGVRDGLQGLLASLPSSRDPAAHTAIADAKHASYLGVS